MRNWFLVLIGIVIGVQPTIASKKSAPDLQQRLATVRSRMRELQRNDASDTTTNDNGNVSRVAQWGNQWGNWNNWNNWGNWVSWNNWGNWGNY
jgi:hypothetical protein